MSPKIQLQEAIWEGDLVKVKSLIKKKHSFGRLKYPSLSGTWLSLAAREGNLDIIKYLISIGFDINALGKRKEYRAIDSAALGGHAVIVKYLIDLGSILDVSDTTCNPLLNAILGKSPAVVRVLLDAGIDASVKYAHTKNSDAVAYAFIRGELEIADMIAEHLSNGVPEKKEKILHEGKQNSALYGRLVPKKILPDI